MRKSKRIEEVEEEVSEERLNEWIQSRLVGNLQRHRTPEEFQELPENFKELIKGINNETYDKIYTLFKNVNRSLSFEYSTLSVSRLLKLFHFIYKYYFLSY